MEERTTTTPERPAARAGFAHTAADPDRGARGNRGLGVRALDDDLRDARLSFYHALDIAFQGPVIKIVEEPPRCDLRSTPTAEVEISIGPGYTL